MKVSINDLLRNTSAIVCFVGLTSISLNLSASGSLSIPSASGSSTHSYQLGKVTLHRKLLCSSCILPKERINSEKAKQLIKRLRFDKEVSNVLSLEERKAVAEYLTRRYDR